MNNQDQPQSKRQLRALKKEEKMQARSNAAKKRQMKRIITWVVAVIVIIGAGYGVSQLGSNGGVSVDGGVLPATDQITERDNVKGVAGAPVTLIEYSDFQCPACAIYYPMVNRLHEEFGDQLQIAYRHFPLTTIHANAALAARATEAAAKQDKFWEMHDLLFINQSDWPSGAARDNIFGYAESLGLDMDQFEQDIDSDEVKDKVSDDRTSGQRAKISGTPSFFLNGQYIENPRSYNDFAELIRNEFSSSVTDTFDSLINDDNTMEESDADDAGLSGDDSVMETEH
jgi:protein-disulfide isomerase